MKRNPWSYIVVLWSG